MNILETVKNSAKIHSAKKMLAFNMMRDNHIFSFTCFAKLQYWFIFLICTNIEA